MKLTAILLLAACLQISAKSVSQGITLSLKNASIEKAFKEIKKQTGYKFIYYKDVLDNTRNVDLSVKNESLENVLNLIFLGQPITYTISGKYIAIKEKKDKPAVFLFPNEPMPPTDVTGRVINERGEPLAGASVRVKGTNRGTQTNEQGEFVINAVPGDVIGITFVGYEKLTYTVKDNLSPVLKMFPAISSLDETVVIAYGTTTRRLNTGSVTKVTAEEIEKQPVSNVLAVLSGKVPGMKAVQQDGLPGGSFDIVIRGQNSLAQGYRPLILLDGVPVSNESMSNYFPGTNSYNSPLNLINPTNIESVEVLKDADATAIYGSRGSNGVILITSKKGTTDKAGLSINAYTGISKSTVTTQLLNTKQYLEMRREAFANDNITPTKSSAPDLLAWDTTRYTNWNDLFYGSHAGTSEIQMGLTGGTASTAFRLGLGYHHETPLYAALGKRVGKQFGYNRGSVQLNVTHKSTDNKLNISLTAAYSLDESKYASYTGPNILLPPNAPYPLDANNELVWEEGGVAFDNPLASLYNTYTANNKNLTSSLTASYRLWKGLQVKVNGGYNTITYADVMLFPKKAQNPAFSQRSSAMMNNNIISNWMIEPMLQFNSKAGPGKIEILAGQTWQAKLSNKQEISARDYQSELFLGTTFGATITATITPSEYLYEGIFGKINYNIDNKYIINATARRDGSSRFGPGRRYSNFGAVGLAYIFSEVNTIKQALPFLSFGKLRANWGITGNDNVGDYMYFESWGNPSSAYSYAGSSGLAVFGLYNLDYSWEKNAKLEAALELGFLNDLLLFNINYYRSKAGNQLVNYKLPSQVGSNSVLKNFEAVILNYGWEMVVSASPLKNRKVNWSISANATIARNKLAAFPNLESSTYANRFVINEPISITRYLPYTGVDPETGLYTYKGTATKDRTIYRNPGTPVFYGGIINTLSYKGLKLEVFSQFVTQTRQSYLVSLRSAPGTMNNQPVGVLNRWQKVGDITDVQRFTTAGSAATAFSRLKQSDAYIVDASYIRIKNVSFSYTFENKILKAAHLKDLSVYFHAQNLGFFSRYKDADPESAGLGNPLTSTYTGGIQLTF